MHRSVRYIVLHAERREDAESSAIEPRLLLDALSKSIVGQADALEAIVLGLIAGGHVLLEGPSGVAKTLTCRALASAIDASFKRIQFTPDLLPSDIVGTQIFDRNTSQFRTQRGPLFANIVLADEINRAPAKVQSALLEAMQERNVTIASESHPLPDPFLVLATMNPSDSDGTYALPLAQIDRFLLNVRLPYPSRSEEYEILRRFSGNDEALPSRIVSFAEVRAWQKAAREVELPDTLRECIVTIVLATRPHETLPVHLHPYIAAGAGPRACLAIAKLARARALLQGRPYVELADIRRVALDVLRHRITLSFRAQSENVDIVDLTRTIVASIPQ